MQPRHNAEPDRPPAHDSSAMDHRAYRGLAIEMTVDFIIMYLVMYTMIWSLAHFVPNLNMLYMTLMMVTPMILVMLVAMRSMFMSRRLNLVIGAGAIMVFAGSFYAMRTQAGVGDRELVRGMIPHHSGAILMCERAKLRDPEIIRLCDSIVKSQRQEIAQMQAALKRL